MKSEYFRTGFVFGIGYCSWLEFWIVSWIERLVQLSRKEEGGDYGSSYF